MTRVRFAPSPTGHLHIGGARTALYNWLFAKQNKGKFILRIEDTDQSRSTDKAIEAIIKSLSWLGLDWDEGPFRQTERLYLYKKAVDKLLKEKKAYYCDADKGNPAVRFKVPQEKLVVDDLVYGKCEFDSANIEDFVILRSNGMPTFHLSVVVDDAEMKITHVIRGNDHLPNTPKHILIFKALGYDIPQFAHLPMILGPDKQRLSKRHGATSVEEFKDQGYLPEAMLNYLALLGWGFDEKTTFFSTDELIKNFSLSRVSKNPSVWDQPKLDWMNGSYIRNLSLEELTKQAILFLQQTGLIKEPSPALPKIIALIQERIKTLSEATRLVAFFFKDMKIDEKAYDKFLVKPDAKKILEKTIISIKEVEPFNADKIEEKLRQLPAELGLKPKIVFQTIRVALTGKTVSPPLFESIELLGKDTTLARLKKL